MADAKTAFILCKVNNIVHEIPVDSEAYRRCKQHPNEYEDVTKIKQEQGKKPEKSGA